MYCIIYYYTCSRQGWLHTGFFPRGGKFSKTIFHAYTQYTTQKDLYVRLYTHFLHKTPFYCDIIDVCLLVLPPFFMQPGGNNGIIVDYHVSPAARIPMSDCWVSESTTERFTSSRVNLAVLTTLSTRPGYSKELLKPKLHWDNSLLVDPRSCLYSVQSIKVLSCSLYNSYYYCVHTAYRVTFFIYCRVTYCLMCDLFFFLLPSVCANLKVFKVVLTIITIDAGLL